MVNLKLVLFSLVLLILIVPVSAQTCNIPSTDQAFTCSTGVTATPASPTAGAQVTLSVSGWQLVHSNIFRWDLATSNWVSAGTISGASNGWVTVPSGSAALSLPVSADTTFAIFACNPDSSNPNTYHCNGDVTVGPTGITGAGKWMLHRVVVQPAQLMSLVLSKNGQILNTCTQASASQNYIYCSALTQVTYGTRHDFEARWADKTWRGLNPIELRADQTKKGSCVYETPVCIVSIGQSESLSIGQNTYTVKVVADIQKN